MTQYSEIHYYFDYLSPYAYFGWFNAQLLCQEYALTLKAHPVLFAGLLNHWGHLGPAEIPAKREFVAKDCVRYAKLHQIEINSPQFHPFNSTAALRLSLPEISGNSQLQVIDMLWKAAWRQGADLADFNQLKSILEKAGFPAQSWLEKTQDPAVKEALRSETEAAIRHGVFGIPSFRVGSELFWGNDRLEYIRLYLDGKDPLDLKKAQEILSRPRGIDRKRILS